MNEAERGKKERGSARAAAAAAAEQGESTYLLRSRVRAFGAVLARVHIPHPPSRNNNPGLLLVLVSGPLSYKD